MTSTRHHEHTSGLVDEICISSDAASFRCQRTPAERVVRRWWRWHCIVTN